MIISFSISIHKEIKTNLNLTGQFFLHVHYFDWTFIDLYAITHLIWPNESKYLIKGLSPVTR